MQLVEQHVIGRDDPRFAVIDAAAFKSKNLYNAALYEIRQAFIFQSKYLYYEEMDKLMQPHEAYKALPAKVSQQVLKQLAAAGKVTLRHARSTESTLRSLRGVLACPGTRTKRRGAICSCIRFRH